MEHGLIHMRVDLRILCWLLTWLVSMLRVMFGQQNEDSPSTMSRQFQVRFSIQMWAFVGSLSCATSLRLRRQPLIDIISFGEKCGPCSSDASIAL